jgi:hypothetical protein
LIGSKQHINLPVCYSLGRHKNAIVEKNADDVFGCFQK